MCRRVNVMSRHISDVYACAARRICHAYLIYLVHQIEHVLRGELLEGSNQEIARPLRILHPSAGCQFPGSLQILSGITHSILNFWRTPAHVSIPTSADIGGSKSPRSACTATSKRVAPKAFTMAPVLLSMRSCPSLLMRKPAMD